MDKHGATVRRKARWQYYGVPTFARYAIYTILFAYHQMSHHAMCVRLVAFAKFSAKKA